MSTALLWHYYGPMRSIGALDVRARFGQVLDEAAAGERFIVERAGQPVAAIVPLRDLDAIDPDSIRARRLAAVDQLVRLRARAQQPALGAAAAVAGTGIERDRRERSNETASHGDEITTAATTKPGRRGRRVDANHRVARGSPDAVARTAGNATAATIQPAPRDRVPDDEDYADRDGTADAGWRQW